MEQPPSESAAHSDEVQPARFQDKNMDNPNTQRRSIGLLVIFATVLTLIAVWNLTETARTETAVSE